MTVSERTRNLTPRQREGRAVNAVAELLRRALAVPNIYIEPVPSLISADVVAVDRGGAGDLHGVEIKLNEFEVPVAVRGREATAAADLSQARGAFREAHRKKTSYQRLRDIRDQVMSMPAHFRYLAVPADYYDWIWMQLEDLGLFAEDGIGRLGLIRINERGDRIPTAEITVTPERFRVDPTKLRAIELRLLTKSPDIQVRI